MKNYGLDLTKEKAELRGDEFLFGASSPACLFAIPEEQRSFFLPTGELQNIGEEKSGCVSRAYLNILETKFTYAYKNDLISKENKKWLEDNGYVEGDTVVFADASIEILSETTKQGNSLKAPAHAIYKHGLVPKKLLPQLEKWDDHYNKDRITDEITNLGKDLLKRFTINYEQVSVLALKDALKVDAVGIAVYAWPSPVNGLYTRQESFPLNHCVAAYAPHTFIFDNYLDSHDGDFIKKLAPDYKVYEYGVRVYVSSQQTPSLADVPEFQRLPLFTWLAKMLAWLFTKSGPMPEIPKEILPEPPKHVSKIDLWAVAAQEFEDYVPPGKYYRDGTHAPQGSASWRRKNPGNIKNSSGAFVVYATYEAGFAALCNYLVRACTDKHQAYVNRAQKLGLKSSGDLTLLQFYNVYSPDGPTIERNYAKYVADKCGVTIDTPIKNLL